MYNWSGLSLPIIWIHVLEIPVAVNTTENNCQIFWVTEFVTVFEALKVVMSVQHYNFNNEHCVAIKKIKSYEDTYMHKNKVDHWHIV